MARLFSLAILLVLFSSACKKEIDIPDTEEQAVEYPCIAPASTLMIAGRIPERNCGILQVLDTMIPRPTHRWERDSLKLDVDLDGIWDFKLETSLSVSPSHHYDFLVIYTLHDRAFFASYRKEYSICHLVTGRPDSYVSIDCREKCSDFLAEDIKDYLDTLSGTGYVQFADGLPLDTPFDDNLRWRQIPTSFTKSKGNPSSKDCAYEVAGLTDKWTRDTTLYLPIKILDDQNMPRLGWIKARHDLANNPVYETYIQAGE